MLLQIFFVLGFLSFGTSQQQQQTSIPLKDQPIHYPRLLHADIPFYPPVAWSGHFGGKVEIEVHLEDGMVKRSGIRYVSILPMGNSRKKEFTAAEREKMQSYLTSPAPKFSPIPE